MLGMRYYHPALITNPSAQHLKCIKYVIRNPPVIFFHLTNVIDHYFIKLNTTMHPQLPTGDSVEYDIHSKPEQIV